MPNELQVALRVFAIIAGLCANAAVFACEPPDVTQLVGDLESDDSIKQVEAVETLARIAEDIKHATPQFERLLKSKSTDARLAAVRALWAIRGKSEAHLPLLVSALGDKKGHNRGIAARMIGQLGPQAASAVPLLTNALKDKDPDVRIEAALALGEIGPMAKSAVPALITALGDHGPSSVGTGTGSMTVSMASGLGLRGIGPDAIPAIAPFLKHHNKEIRISAMWVLAGGGKASRPHVSVLIESLTDAHEAVRQAAVETLGELRLAPMESIPALATLLNDKNKSIRFWSATALVRYGPQAKLVLPQLIAALQDDHPGVRARAADAIGEIGPAAKDALPHLKRLREDRDFFFYAHAATDSVGPHAVAAIAKIQTDRKPKSKGK